MKPRVYSYGMIVESNAVKLQGSFPKSDDYAEITDWRLQPSGEACNTAIALSRLGCKVTLDGAWLAGGRAETVIGMIGAQGVDPRLLARSSEGRGFRELVITDGGTRTVFGSFARILTGSDSYWNEPDRASLEASDFVTVDSQFGEFSETVARLAHEAGKRATASDPRLGQRLLGTVEAATISMEHLRERKLEADPIGALKRYLAEMNGLCVLTQGKEGSVFARADHGRFGELTRVPAFPIEPVDSLGAGDSFRAGIALGLYLGLEDREAVVFASALAALVCLSFPGVLNGPSMAELVGFLRERGEGRIAGIAEAAFQEV
jgi:sugar/nucleoside kinase (ribokinase family)